MALSVNGKQENQRTLEDDENDDIKRDEEWEKNNLRFGWGNWTPGWLQRFNTIRWFVFWACVFSLFQGFIVNGVINAIISTLEKRFELPSSKSGLIVSSNDFFACFLVLVISYYGSHRHKPKIIGIGILTLGLGSFVFSLPHFMTERYSVGTEDTNSFENVCRFQNGTTSSSCEKEKSSDLQNYLWLFMLGNALHGAGSTPMFTLGTTFIDENTQAKMTSLYLGIVYAAASIGVAAGYMLGGQTLNLFTDFHVVDPKNIGLSPIDPRWVGAWWLSFLVSGTVMCIVVFPMCAYPKRLPGSSKLQADRKSEAYKGEKMADDKFGKDWKAFPLAMKNLILNPTFFFLAIGTCTEGLIVSGTAAFGPKFMQEKFNLPAALASFIMGIITVPGAGGGMFLGGYLVKKLKLKCKGIIRMNLISAVAAAVMGCLFLIGCPSQHIAGVTTEYTSHGQLSSKPELQSQCNAGCGCSAMMYDPVCGIDGSIYFTPCHAGCNLDFDWLEGPMGPFKFYKNCSCITASMIALMNSTPTSGPEVTSQVPMALESTTPMNSVNVTGPPIGAFQGICMSDCKLFYLVAPLFFLGMLLTFMTVSPTQTATLRCVPESQKTLAIGTQWLLLRLLGTTPGPLMIGSIIDSACKVWQDVCGETGSCWIYEKSDMGIRIFIWWCLVKSCSVVCYFLAQYFYRAPTDNTDELPEEQKTMHPIETLNTRESVI
ncbi:solute carrier organic anion transporter family member 4A1-like [Mizuhopecten yessoensis]|uniref:solute carrier organic anion transporter family member 4A1-like n=1 Tax=Mizuhopecten yessoensis TaxID=6573 RepID=UPI000B45A3E8|nr:solute carrier organic anion transporter family member 4A1-like [Mizuhopecten yessoensis]